MDGYLNINTTGWASENIKEKAIISLTEPKNYIYFYLNEGIGEINGIHFSGNRSSFVLFSSQKEDITIIPTTPKMFYYYNQENLKRLQTRIDFSTGGKFLFKKDFPFDFYTAIDGTKDVTFSLQFLKFKFSGTENSEHLIEIKAYILDSTQIEFLKEKNENQPSSTPFQGYYDQGHRVGKIVVKKEEIKAKLTWNYQNYLYIIASKSSSLNVIYEQVEGQYTFVPMDFIHSFIPESFYIFSNLSQGQKSPHLYAVQLEQELDKKTRVEFISSGNELDCAVIQYKNYILGSDEYYEDYTNFKINRITSMGKNYIDITQANKEKDKVDYAIISIFSKNGGHIAVTEQTKLSYEVRYTTYSDYGIFTFNDEEGT